MSRRLVSLLALILLSSMLLLHVSYAQDTTPPTGSIVINNGAYYTRATSVVLTLTYSDGDGSGIDKVRYTNANEWTSEPWEDPVSVKDWNLTSGDGMKYVSYQIRDKVGLISNTFFDNIILDNTPPTGSIKINGGADTTNTRSVTLTMTYADAGSGVDKVRYTNNYVWGNEQWETPTTTKSWDLSEGEGKKYVTYQILDKSGLKSTDIWDSITLDYGAVATPTFSPVGGTYTSVQNVVISCSTEGSTIRYTTDGSEPLSTSLLYSSPIEVSSSMTIKAKAFRTEMDNSQTATATYAINLPAKVATPAFSPVGGTYTSVQNVVISCSTEGSTIRYTTDGSEPSSASTVYSSALSIDVTTTVKAKAFKDGMTNSDTATATYSVNLPVKISSPTFFPVAGTYTSVQNVTISCSTEGAIIRYTTDGSEPSSASALYLGPVQVGSSTMIKAKAFKDGMIDSDTATATYVINIVTPSPNGGAFISPAVFYAVIIIVVAAIVAVVLLLLRRARPKSPFTQRTTKPKLTKG
jgi:hypothetical protein